MDLHIISHTHWDREWHKTFQEYRVKLIKFMDELIELLEKDEKFTSFMLDGQTIVLEDYLDVKPYMKSQIKNLVEKGKLIIGPWYIQPDEFIPSGESLIRNLVIGEKIGKEFGQVMKVGYLPDSFGQSAQIPQVLKGWGIDYAVFWRGITNQDMNKTEFLWRAPDGSEVLTIHLPLGYGNAKMLSTDINESIKVIEENVKSLKEKATTLNLLLMSGFDQRMANPELPNIIDDLNHHYRENEKNVFVKLSSIEEYIDSVKNNSVDMRVLSGEFRKGKDMRVHVSIAGTRIDLKKDNFKSQVLYEKYLEPINSMAYLLNGEYDQHMITTGWKYIVQNHAHDSICSVCTDDTHKEMKMRYKAALQIGNSILNENLSYIANRIKYQEERGKPIIVFNTLTCKRKDIVDIILYLKNEEFIITDSEGTIVHSQIENIKEVNLSEENIEIGVKNADQYCKEIKVKFIANMNGYGYKTYYVKENTKNIQAYQCIGKNPNILENEIIKVDINKNGSLRLTDKKTNKVYDQINYFEEGGNAGDEYDFSPPRNDIKITTEDSCPSVNITENGPINATIEVKYLMNLPIDTDVNRRSDETKICSIKSYITLYKGLDRVDVKTIIDNNVKNHRMRALFQGNVFTETHIAQQQFGVIERKNYLEEIEYWEQDEWEEKYYPIYPQQNFVDVSDGKHGLAILNKGLPQYEILNKNKPIIALTLLSGTDYMGKQDLLDRPGRRSGLHVETLDSLILGTFETEYAIIPHTGNYVSGNIPMKGDSYVAPLKAYVINGDKKEGILPAELYFMSSQGPEVMTSAIKKCENEDDIIWRIYNATKMVKEHVQIFANKNLFINIQLVNFKEEKINDDRVIFNDDGIYIRFLNSNEIFTFKLNMDKFL